jgi:hypothetical protein
VQFYKIQRAAGIEIVCPKDGQPGHVCGDTCHLYGFHAFRYTHARFNYTNPELQNQMGHAHSKTTEHCREWAERHMGTYGAYLPAEISGETPQQRKNGGDESGERPFRVVGA